MKYSLIECRVEVNDIITPMTCSAMVIEFIKYIIYQKQLIPYPYERLKMYVDMRKKQLEGAKVCYLFHFYLQNVLDEIILKTF